MIKILVSDKLAAEGVEILKTINGADVTVRTGMNKEELLDVIP